MKRLISAFTFLVFKKKKRGERKGIIKIGKLSNKGNIIKERRGHRVKSKVNIVRNLQLRTF
jgi:hypothetical protein